MVRTSHVYTETARDRLNLLHNFDLEVVYSMCSFLSITDETNTDLYHSP